MIAACQRMLSAFGGMLNENTDKPGAIAPLVLDAPFSSLDDDVAPRVGKILRESSEQLVILVNNKDYKAMEGELETAVGKRYYFFRSEDVEATDENIEIDRGIVVDGKTYSAIEYGQEKQKTAIKEIKVH